MRPKNESVWTWTQTETTLRQTETLKRYGVKKEDMLPLSFLVEGPNNVIYFMITDDKSWQDSRNVDDNLYLLNKGVDED